MVTHLLPWTANSVFESSFNENVFPKMQPKPLLPQRFLSVMDALDPLTKIEVVW